MLNALLISFGIRPSSFAVLGMAGGVLATVIIGGVTLYTTHVLWQYCMKYPLTRDVCDVAFKCVPLPSLTIE